MDELPDQEWLSLSQVVGFLSFGIATSPADLRYLCRDIGTKNVGHPEVLDDPAVKLSTGTERFRNMWVTGRLHVRAKGHDKLDSWEAWGANIIPTYSCIGIWPHPEYLDVRILKSSFLDCLKTERPLFADDGDTGATADIRRPGRPQTSYNAVDEFNRRVAAGEEIADTATEMARILQSWWESVRRDRPPLEVKTIRDKISSAHRAWKAGRPKL